MALISRFPRAWVSLDLAFSVSRAAALSQPRVTKTAMAVAPSSVEGLPGPPSVEGESVGHILGNRHWKRARHPRDAATEDGAPHRPFLAPPSTRLPTSSGGGATNALAGRR